MDEMMNQKQNFIKQCERAILEQVSNRLEEAIELKNAGKDEEADALVKDMINWLVKKLGKKMLIIIS